MNQSDNGGAPYNAHRDRPHMPEGYGEFDSDETLLPWTFVDERLTAARNYWVASTRPGGRPHAVPTWGVWLDGAFYMEGSPDTRRFRNLTANPAVSVHLESGDEVVILEGTTEEMGKPDQELAQRLSQDFTKKYSASGYSPGPDQWDRGGLYRVKPHLVLAWSEFPATLTRWRFIVREDS
jgi:nitroimidazol reductase NimA-like FMN-containing flavoprotein (pyridoxamine 5'-phosphate oxidase superfamily)